MACDTVDALAMVTLAPGVDADDVFMAAPETVADLLEIGYSPLPVLWGADFVAAEATQDGGGYPAVMLTLSTDAGARFAEVTLRRAGEPMALILGNTVLATPTVLSPIIWGEILLSGQTISRHQSEIFNSVIAFNGDCPSS